MKSTFDNRKEWRNSNGQLHRKDGPARIWDTGVVEYWLDGNKISQTEVDLRFLKSVQVDFFDFLMEKTLKEEIPWEVKFVDGYPNALHATFNECYFVLYSANLSFYVNNKPKKLQGIERLKDVIEAQMLISLQKARYAIS